MINKDRLALGIMIYTVGRMVNYTLEDGMFLFYFLIFVLALTRYVVVEDLE